MTRERTAPDLLVRALGLGLAGVVRLLRRWRERPLHPVGVVLHARLVLEDSGAPGATALGAPASHPATVRFSRAAGTPAPLPDVFGLAIRWHEQGRDHDVLLATTGLGRVTRFLLVPRTRPLAGGFGTLMPFRDRDGPVIIAAVPSGSEGPSSRRGAVSDGGAELTLLSARPLGPWRRLGALSCGEPIGSEPGGPSDEDAGPSRGSTLRFDPVLHAPGALGTYRWAAVLRRPSYRAARGD